MKKSIVLLVVMMVWNAASSQKALKLSDFDKQYQNQEGVIAHDEDYITINVTETGELSIVNNHQQRALYFTEVGALYVDDYIYYSLFNTIENIEAKIFDVKGKSYSVAQVTVQDGQGGGIFLTTIKLND